MPIALIHSKKYGKSPMIVEGANTESSFYTDGPSITAVAGFIGMLSELKGLEPVQTGMLPEGMNIQAGKGFSFFIHDYRRDIGKVSMNSSNSTYSDKEKDVKFPPIPIEYLTANMSFSIVFEYVGNLPHENELDDILNFNTRRFNGGSIVDDIMISDISEDTLLDYFKCNRANQVIDNSELNITSFDEMLEYVTLYQNKKTKGINVLKHQSEKSRSFYLHQTGYQLLEDPKHKKGTLLNGDQLCKHAYCEPIINIAGLKHTVHLKGFSDLNFWQWKEDKEKRTILLTSKN